MKLRWVLWGLSASMLVLAGCGGDDSGDSPSTGGSAGMGGGSSGSGGTGTSGSGGTGTAGSGGGAGAAGTGGTGTSGSGGGTSGSGGGTSGSGGSAGAAGTAGSGGSAGAAGTAGSGGSAGAAGTAGSGGSAGAAGTAGSGGSSGITECNDGIDNDGDGLVDWQQDLGCANAGDDDETAAPRDQEGGFSTFDVGAGSQVIYVSSSEGDDNNDGTSPAEAVATLARGAELVRDGENDFMLLRRGDVWRGESLGRFKSGQDAAHPLVLASYGDSTALPRIEVNQQFIDHNGKARSFVAVIGLEIVSYPKIPGDSDFDGATGGGFRYVGGGQGLLIEGCHLVYGEVVVQSYGTEHYDGVEVRRNVIEQSYHVGTCGQNSAFRPSGMYSSHVTNLTIEGNVFDHNGWNEEVTEACATMYNHNMYLNADGLVVRDNIIARASSMGIKMRSDATGDAEGLVFENNLLVDGEIGIGIGGNTSEPARFSEVTIRNNVFTEIGLGNPTDRNFSWMLAVADNVSATIEDNYFLHQPWYTNAYGISLGGGSASDITVSGNTFYNLRARSLRVRPEAGWSNVSVVSNTFVDPTHDSCLVDHEGGFGAVSYANNAYLSSAGNDWFCVDGNRRSLSEWTSDSGESGAMTHSGSFADPTRTVSTYASSLGLASNLEAFLEVARQQSRLTWRSDMTANAVNDYIRAGFQ
jgi:hypothetical protein